METNRERNIAKLKELGVLWQWLRNAYLQNDVDVNFKVSINNLLSQDLLSNVLIRAFEWDLSKEGHLFWEELYFKVYE